MTPTATPPFDVEAHALEAAGGDRDALGALYEHFYDQVLRYIGLRTENNLTVAEDIAAVCWEKVARAIRDFTPLGTGFSGWLYTIARRCVQEHYRTMIRRPERLDGEMLVWDRPDQADSIEAVVEQRIINQQVAAAVRGLSNAQRRCVTLRFFVGLTLAETADVMDKSPNAIKQLQHRALGVLRDRLGPLPVQEYDADTYVGADEYEATHRIDLDAKGNGPTTRGNSR